MKFLKPLRLKLNLSRYRMAQLLDVSNSHYKHMEENGRMVAPEILQKIQDISGLKDDEFWKLVKKSFNEEEHE